MVLLFNLKFNKKLEAFLEIANHGKFTGDFDRIQLRHDRLEVLKVKYPIPGFFQLILEVPFKLTPDIVNEDPGNPEVLSKEVFEDEPCDGSGALMATLVLSLSEFNGGMEKWGCKWYIIYFNKAWCFKIVLTLLTKVVIFYIELIPICFWAPIFKRLISWFC